ncbi:MAG TPA: hypothetical protein VGK94_07960 [Candidatus Polarisedimenticolia bacterium]|jgi:hypothetical protein
MGGVTEKLGGTLTRYLGAAALGALAKSSVEEFAKIERAFNGLRLQLQGLGYDADRELPKVQAFLEGIRAGGGGLVSETLPALRQLLGLTGDLGAAMRATRLVSDMAESGMGDFSQALDAVASILSGRVSRSIKQFGINVSDDVIEKSVDASKFMQILIDKFDGFGAKIDDTQNQLDKLSGSWERLKNTIGESVAKVGQFAMYVPAAIAGVGAALGHAYTNWAGITRDGWTGIADEFKKGMESILGTTQETSESTFDFLKASADHVADLTLLEVAGQKAKADAAQEAAKAEKKAAEERIAAFMQLVAKRTAAEVEAHERSLDLTEEQREALRKADEDFSATQREKYELIQREIEAAADAERARVEAALQTDKLTLESRQLLEDELIRLDQQKALRAATLADEVAAINTQAAHKDLLLARALARQKIETYKTIAQASVDFSVAVFGQNKIAAIAQAIIDTVSAVQSALADLPYPYNIVVAAIVAAIGAANVNKIRTTEMESSGTFDTPTNDQIARVGTKKSAEDFVRLAQEGIGQGLRAAFALPGGQGGGAAGEAGGVTYQITINGMYGGDSGLRDLRDVLNRAERLRAPRRLR